MIDAFTLNVEDEGKTVIPFSKENQSYLTA